jgi:hypothetical protein
LDLFDVINERKCPSVSQQLFLTGFLTAATTRFHGNLLLKGFSKINASA